MTKRGLTQEALKRMGFKTVGQVSYGPWKSYAVRLHPLSRRYSVEAGARLWKRRAALWSPTSEKPPKAACPKGIKALAAVKNGLRVAVSYLFTREGIGVLLQESISEFLLVVFGVFFTWRFLNQTNSGEVAAVNTVERTLRPIDGRWNDSDWHENQNGEYKSI